ncbi:MAG: DUF397 domain-containing protein [Streptomyces sp.]|jgi:Domain of unknown function (DUF397)|uniref:DUF397 domain-containing protein n=1 Tax=Streptomyces sp. TaxID=1931 RepID=UPI0025E09E9D|nr:DUF397 domain-containing protein [Streptomyces sp.]MBW8800340.1 DUF397 domain-containing protein [Streptomyces sp.]
MIRKTTAEDASGLTWFKSSYSSSSEGDSCVEVAISPSTVHVRDSKNIATPSRGPHLAFPPATWTAFLSHAAAVGE